MSEAAVPAAPLPAVIPTLPHLPRSVGVTTSANWEHLFTLSSTLFCTVNDRGCFVDLNEAWSTVLGWTRQDLLDQPYLTLVHPDDRDRTLAQAQQQDQGHSTVGFQNRYRCLDGSYRWLEWHAYLDKPSQVVYAMARDVTERRVAEEERRRLMVLLEATPDLVAVADANQRLCYLNPAGRRMLGLGQTEDIPPRHIADLLSRSARDRFQHETLPTLLHDGLWRGETTLNHGQGHEVPVSQVVIAHRETSEAGQIAFFSIIAHDISPQRQAHEALRESAERFRTMVDNIPGAMYRCLYDSEWTMLFISDAVFELTGYRPRELIQSRIRSFGSLIHPDDLATVQATIETALNNRTPFSLEYQIVHRDGSIRWVAEKGCGSFDAAGNLLWIDGAIFDLTEHKAIEAALRLSNAEVSAKAADLEHTLRELQSAQAQLIQTEKMSGLGQMVAGVAHEINNPVNFIYGNVDHARSYINDLVELIETYRRAYPDPLPEVVATTEEIDLEFVLADLPKTISSMQVGADRIKEIVLSLRNFSRMDEAAMKAVDLHEGIDSTLTILNHRLKAKHERPEIAIVRRYGTLPRIECYAGQLNQVFMNVLVNAIDALEERASGRSAQANLEEPGQICIQTEIINQRAVVRISDNGLGIPLAIQARLFDPFFTTKPVGKGTGLGLSIAYQIVTEKHGGTIVCHSTQGVGTTFEITIPLCQVEEFP